MLRAVLFDLDNTLVNFWKFKLESAKAASHAMVEAGLPMGEAACYERIFAIYKTHGVEYQQTFTHLVESLKLEPAQAEKIRDAGVAAYLKSKRATLRPYAGVPKMLAGLQDDFGLKLGVLTDAPREQAHQRLEFSGLRHYFEAVGTFHDTNAFKPAAAPFLHICQKMKIEPQEALMVGDNPSRDIAGAHLLGMRTCLAQYDPYFSNQGPAPDFEIAQPLDLLDVVGKLLSCWQRKATLSEV